MVFFPIFDSPLPPCYTLLCFLKPPFTITWLSDTPPPPRKPIDFSVMKLWYFVLFYFSLAKYLLSNFYSYNSSKGDFKKLLISLIWCSMIITLFLAGLPPPPCYKMLWFSWPPPPLMGHNVICEWPLINEVSVFNKVHSKYFICTLETELHFYIGKHKRNTDGIWKNFMLLSLYFL